MSPNVRRALADAFSASSLPPPNYRLLAGRLLMIGNKPAAVAALMAAADERPEDHQIHAALAALLSDLDQFPAAVGAALMAVEHGPANAQAQAELGRALFLSGRAEEALAPCARAVVLAPDNLGALVTFGAVLFTTGRYREAMEAAREALAIEPGHFQARCNLALALEGLGQLREAEAELRRALELEPESPQARHNLATLLLSNGDLTAEAWRLYDARLGLSASARALEALPRWGGEDVAGKTVLLHAEQGFGDTIQFVRYAPMVAARGARVILAVQPALRRLYDGMPGVEAVVAIGGALPAHDLMCPLASLPRVFQTDLGRIPAPLALTAPVGSLALERPAGQGGLQVGLAWAGNPGFVHDQFRSMDPALLTPLADMEGVTFHSLQLNSRAPFAMRDQTEGIRDFGDTAGLIAGLDLVICVDTAVAHLAATMGKPAWVMSRYLGCWRWLRQRTDSPWYPTIRLFRQKTPGDWRGVVAEVETALRCMVGV